MMKDLSSTIDFLDKSIEVLKNIMHDESTIRNYLLLVAYKHYPQADNYFANRIVNKIGVARWEFGSSNDYPLQHGKGDFFVLPEKLIICLMNEYE